MAWDSRKLKLQHLIEQDTGIIRARSTELDAFAQKRAQEIKREINPRDPTELPTHRGWLPGDPITSDTWASYWEELPDWVTMFGENLTWNYLYKDTVRAAQNYKRSDGTLVGWFNSPLHKKNEMNTNFKHIGLGIARRILSGDEDNPLAWRWYYTAILTN